MTGPDLPTVGVSVLPVARAHADAWAVQSGTRPGGATALLPGVRVVCSGTRHAQYNGADLLDPWLADPAAVAAWFADRGTPWAWRVPAELGWTGGELFFRQRLMGLHLTSFRPVRLPEDCTVAVAGAGDLDDVVTVDVAAFGGSRSVTRQWLAGHLATPGVEVAVVRRAPGPRGRGRAVGTAYTVLSQGDAGPAVMLAGVGVVPDERGRGIAAGLSSWCLARGFAAGAAFAHLQPDDERAARVYARLGFTEAPGLEIRHAAAP